MSGFHLLSQKEEARWNESLKNGVFRVFKEYSDKHHKTVDNSYKLLYTVCGWKGKTGNPVIRNKWTGKQATGISAGSRRDWLKERRRLRVCGQESN